MQGRHTFIEQHSQLFWYFNQQQLQQMTDDVLLEFVLNYGNLTDVKALLQLFGLPYAAKLFARHTRQGNRHNYLPQVANYFSLYFSRNAPEYFK